MHNYIRYKLALHKNNWDVMPGEHRKYYNTFYNADNFNDTPRDLNHPYLHTEDTDLAEDQHNNAVHLLEGIHNIYKNISIAEDNKNSKGNYNKPVANNYITKPKGPDPIAYNIHPSERYQTHGHILYNALNLPEQSKLNDLIQDYFEGDMGVRGLVKDFQLKQGMPYTEYLDPEHLKSEILSHYFANKLRNHNFDLNEPVSHIEISKHLVSPRHNDLPLEKIIAESLH